MKKRINILCALVIGFAISANTVFALEVYVADQAVQGSTLKIELPAYDILRINGDFEGEPVFFYKITRPPKPEETISRAEFLEMMFLNHNFGEVDFSEMDEFPDVTEDDPYYEYIMSSAALGIINGYDDGKFRPYTPVTRGQIAKILVNAFAQKKVTRVKVSSASSLEVPPFPDVPPTHRFYSFINQSVQAAWFKGYPDGYMRPDRHINYSEAEIVIKRAALPSKFTPLSEKPYYLAYLGIDRKIETGIHNLGLQIKTPNNETENKVVPINITKRDVPVVRFSLPKEKTDLFGADAQDKTWTAVYAALANPTSTQLWDGKFTVPTTGQITLGFGDQLYINGAYSGSHFGIDYANKDGTPIYAPNNGKITLSEYTPAFGNTIVLDHGRNVFTMYLHISELKTVKGAQVNKGDLIGLMGSTGISSGPHLHYTQFIGDVIVDSDQWIWNEM